MADILEIVSKEAIQGILDAGKGIINLDENLLKLQKNIDGYKSKMQEVNDSTKELSEKSTAYSKILSDVEREQIKINASAKEMATQQRQISQTEAKLNTAHSKTNQTLQQKKLTLREQNQLMQAEAVLNNKNAGTLQKLAAQNKKLSIEKKNLNLETETGRKRLQEINTIQDQNNKFIKESGNVLEQQKIRIGDYGSAWESMPRGVQSARVAVMKFMAMPLVALVAAIVGAFMLLRKALGRSEEGQNALNKASNIMKSVFEALMDVTTRLAENIVKAFENPQQALKDFGRLIVNQVVNRIKGTIELVVGLGNVIGKVFKGDFKGAKEEAIGLGDSLGKIYLGMDKEQRKAAAEKLANGFKGLNNQIRENLELAKQLSDSQANYNVQERKYIKENAQLSSEASKMRADAEQLKRTNAEQSIKLEEEALKLEQRKIDNEIELAKIRLANQKLTMAQGADSIEDKKQLAELEAALINLEAQGEDARRGAMRKINMLRAEAFKQENDRQKARFEIEKSIEEESIRANQEIIKDTNTSLEMRLFLMEENKNRRISIIENESEIAHQTLNKELELNLISREDYNLQVQKLEQDRTSKINEINRKALSEKTKDEQKELQELSKQQARSAQIAYDQKIMLLRANSANEKEFAAAKFELDKQMLAEVIEHNQLLLENSEITGSARLEIENQIAEQRLELEGLLWDKEQATNEKRLEAIEKIKDASINTANEIFNFRSALLDRESALLEEQNKRGLLTEQEYAKKKAEIELKQAKTAKAQGIFNAIINTAQGVTAALKVAPPLGFILAGLAGAMGAMQIASIASQPLPSIPAFAEGTHGLFNTPSTFLAGEAGTEIVQKNGKSMIVDKPTIFTSLKGARVFSNPETEYIMNWKEQGGVQGSKYDAMLFNEMKGLRKDIKNMPQPIIQDGRKVGIKQNNHTKKILNLYKYGRS